MKIFITGNLGYVGATLCQYLRSKYPNAFLAGYDLGYFQHCLTTEVSSPEHILNAQFYGDVRNFNENLLEGFDHVIHLAAISNDPIGNKFEQVTMDVNYESTVRIAEMASRHKVKSFVFASSCSVYGAGGDDVKTERASVDPLTAYARSKVMAEKGLSKIKGDTIITCLRFATACGMSDRLRLDLVLNDFVASALTTGSINILSDGTPWRPLINVNDMANAIDWAISRKEQEGGKFLICNAGSNDWNYTVHELAQHVKEQFNDIEVTVNPTAPPDKRSYKVNFDLFLSYANGHSPSYDIDKTISGIKTGLNGIGFHDKDFRKSKLIRLNELSRFLATGRLDLNLNWIAAESVSAKV
jgi:nucleoside-diphosphate-sugar epimerase